jgi:hypothetical protein
MTSAPRRRAERGSERLQRHHPERTPARATVDAGWRVRPRVEDEREGAV